MANAVSRNAFNKFESFLLRYYNEGPESLDDNEHEQLKDILDFIRNFQEGKIICYYLLLILIIKIIKDKLFMVFLIRSSPWTCNSYN